LYLENLTIATTAPFPATNSNIIYYQHYTYPSNNFTTLPSLTLHHFPITMQAIEDARLIRFSIQIINAAIYSQLFGYFLVNYRKVHLNMI